MAMVNSAMCTQVSHIRPSPACFPCYGLFDLVLIHRVMMQLHFIIDLTSLIIKLEILWQSVLRDGLEDTVTKGVTVRTSESRVRTLLELARLVVRLVGQGPDVRQVLLGYWLCYNHYNIWSNCKILAMFRFYKSYVFSIWQSFSIYWPQTILNCPTFYTFSSSSNSRDGPVSRPIHGLVSALRPNVSVSRADVSVSVSVSVSISTFQVSSPLLFSLKFTCDDSLLKLSALITSIEASTIIRAECSRTLLSVLHRCDIWCHLCLRKYCWSEE